MVRKTRHSRKSKKRSKTALLSLGLLLTALIGGGIVYLSSKSSESPPLQLLPSPSEEYQGIPNLGNTCFMNSTLQALAEFRNLRTNNDLLNNILRMLRTNQNVTSLVGLLRSKYQSRFDYGREHDSAEFLRELIDIPIYYYDFRRQSLALIDGPKNSKYMVMCAVRFNDDGSGKRHDLINIPVQYGQYKLKAIISHIGPSIESGHYITFIPHGNYFISISDDCVTMTDNIDFIRETAYMMFYEWEHNGKIKLD